MTVQSSTKDDLFNLDLIRSYVDKELNPRFVERHWLKQQIEDKLTDPDCRFVLLTAEPGAGKSAFMAWLAHQHPDWCRYFIRRDQRTPLGDVGSYSFLLQVGFQLAATYPDLFKQEQIRIVVEQRIGTATNSEIVGAEIGKMFASPFYEKVIQIQQQVTHSKDTNVTGVRIGEFYATERDLPIENLQFMALFDPAKAMMKQIQEAVDHPHQQIVVLVDALDELRYQDSEPSLLKWLTNCPELPANLRFVLTCRPDDDLLRAFRGSQQGRIQEMSIAEEDPDVEKDLTLYTRFLIETPEVNQTLIEMHQDSDAFTRQAITKANGNFGYLGAIGRAVDEAIRQNEQQLLREILKLSELPDTLQDLYAFFLGKIKDAVAKEKVEVEDAEGEIGFVSVWSAVYKPILGILSVALEPLTPTQIQKLGLIQAEFDYVTGAIERLQQFLDQLGNCYRLYHSTLPEFFTSPKTQERKDYAYCYVDAIKQNQRIVNYYQAGAKSWAEVNLKKIAEDEYGRRHLAQHLVKGDQVDELHTLLSLEKDRKNAWFKVKDDEGDTASFLADVELAWSQADEAYDREPGKSIGLQCRYALIKSSINRLAEVPTALMIALVKHQYWKPAKAFAYARQIPSPKERFESLTSLADQLANLESLKSQVLQAALEAALAIPYKEPHALALITLADKIPPTLLPIALAGAEAFRDVEVRARVLTALSNRFPDVLPKALDAALAIQYEYDRARALIALSDKLPELLPKALEVSLAVQNRSFQAYALLVLADKLPEVLPKALEASLAIQDEKERTQVLTLLADKLPPDLLPTVLADAEAFLDEHCRAQVLTVLANKMPAVLPQALKSALAIQDEFQRADALTALGDKLPPELLPQALKSVLAIQDEFYRAKALSALADKLPDLPLEALEVVQSIPNEFSLPEALSALADKLPSDLFPQALDTALAIQNEECRAQALIALADSLPLALLNQALESALAIQDKKFCAQVLIALADKLPNILPKALEAAQSIQDQWYSAKTLIALVDSLPFEQLPQVLEVVLSIQNELSRSEALAAIADKLPPYMRLKALEAAIAIQEPFCIEALLAFADQMPEVLSKALTVSQAIQDDYYRGQVLGRLVDKLPLNLLPKCLEAAQSIPYEFLRFDVLAALVDKLPEALPEALATALAFKNEYGGPARALLTLADKLPETLPKALEAAQAIQNDYDRSQALLALADKLPEVLPEALTTALAIQDEYNRAIALLALADKLPTILPKALEAAQAIQDDYYRSRALLALADKLPEILPEALATAMAAVETLNELERANAFMRFADRLTTDLLPQALVVVLAIHDEHERAKALAALAGKLPEALLKALEAAQAMQENFFRAEVLAALALPLINAPNRFELWKDLLHFLSYRNRPAWLSDIAALIPVVVALGKKEAAVGIAQAIENVSRWWT